MRRTAFVTVLTLVGLAAFASPARADTVVPTLVRETLTSQWSPPSPDPMGIVYQPSSGRLLVVDSEVEEMTIYQNVNFWETSLTGSVQRTGKTTAWSNEPTDIGLRPSNGHYFIPDDNLHKIFEVAVGNDGLFGTSDDTVTSTAISAWGSSINGSGVEGITFGGGDMYFTDGGTDSEVYRVQPGSNGKFDGAPPTGDDVVSHFDTAAFGQTDPEAVSYNTDTNTLYIGSRKVRFISEVSLSGVLIRNYDLSSYADFKSSSGIAYAPSSNNATGRSLYVVDRHVDNDSNPSENDGILFEFAVGSAPGNSPPVVTNPGNKSSNEGVAVSLQVVATDPDAGDTLTYSASALPSGLSINSSTGLITGTVSSAAAAGSPYSSSVTASDGQAGDTKNFTWTVSDTTSPVVTNPGTQNNDEGDVINLQISASDADADTLTYSAGGLPPGLSISSSTGRITGTVNNNAGNNSPYASSVTASDGSTGDTEAFTWTIGVPPPPNNPPVVTNPGPKANSEGDSVNLQIAASDPDVGQTLTYSASGLPTGLSINTSTGIISGTVSSTAGAGSPYSSSVTASDGQDSDTKNFTWTIADPTQPSVTNPGTKSNNEGASVSLQVTASDGDGDTLTYSASGLPTGLSINTSTGLISGTISAGAASGSPFPSSVTAADGSSSDTANFTWTVNGPPVVTNPGNQSNAEGAAVSLQVIATDPNAGDALTYSASGLPPGLSINTSTGLISGTISGGAAAGSPYSSHVGASDGSLSDSKNFTWTVNGPPGVPAGLVIDSRTTGLFLNWVDNSDSDLAGYNVYRSDTSGGNFTRLNGSPLTVSEYNDATAKTNDVSYYRVTAVDTGANESGPATANGTRSSIVFVAVSANQGKSTSVKISKPTGTASGDMLLAAISVRGAPTVIAPAGWNLVEDQTAPSSAMRQVVFSHSAGSSEPSSYTFTLGARQAFVGQIVAYRGVGVGGVTASGGQGNASSSAITAPSVTAATAYSVEVGFFGTAVFTSIAPPAGMFERGENGRSAGASGTHITIETADDVVDAGPLGIRSAQASTAAANVGLVIVLSPTP